jgi:hypothetical protein
MVLSRAEGVLILEQSSAWNSFAAVREEFSNACLDTDRARKEVTTHRLLTTFRDSGSVYVFENLVYNAVTLFYKFFIANKFQKKIFVLIFM